jgi:hypothetical protein
MSRLVRSNIKKGNIRLYTIFCKDWREKNRIRTQMNDKQELFYSYYQKLGNGCHTANVAMFCVWKLPADKPLLDIIFRQIYLKVNRKAEFINFLREREKEGFTRKRKRVWPANTLIK